MKKYNVHTRAYKREALRLWQSGERSAAEVEDELGLRHGSLYEWKHRYGAKGIIDERAEAQKPSQPERLRQLERENQQLRQEVEILKKAVAIFTQASR